MNASSSRLPRRVSVFDYLFPSLSRRLRSAAWVGLVSFGSIAAAGAEPPTEIAADIAVIREHLHRDYSGMLREEGGAFKYPFLTPGSAQYPDILWDWDSWLSNVALRQVLA